MRTIDLIRSAYDQEDTRVSQRQQMLHFERERLFTSVRPRLLQIARLRGVAPDALEDVVQETLLVAWKKLDHLYAPEHVHLWLDEICRNVCSRYVFASHKNAARQVSLFDAFLHPEHDEPEEALLTSSLDMESRDPAEVFSRQDLFDLLRQALDLLPEQAREAVEMYYLLELPQREVAVRLGLSISALETRLHRARRQLRQILSGELRAQATSFDLPLDEELAMGWRATGVWCYYCGHQRLHGSFETLPDGQRYLRMRCPECSQRFGFDIVNSKGLVGVSHLRSFQPAFKRTMRELSWHLLHAVASGEISCGRCGRAASLHVGGPKKETSSVPDHPLQRRFWVRGLCPHCGHVTGGFSADDAVYWSHPAVQAFMQRYPRWLNEPDLPIEYNGQAAILFRLSDRLSATQLHVIAHRQTLQVLAAVQQ